MAVYKFVISDRLAGMNEYTAANRRNRYVGNKMKHDAQSLVCKCIREQLNGVVLRIPIEICYNYFEKDKRRDHDNVHAFAAKVIQDALVECGLINNDGWNEITSFCATFEVDRQNPRIEVSLHEVNV